MDIDAGGAAVTGGLIAGAVERPAGQAGDEHHHCADCGHAVSGRFCSNCGQPAHVHRTLLHLGEEILHGVMHFDGRLWRTLPLLVFKPGKLTRQWIEGKRTRFVSPLAIFLFTMFVMFFALSFAPQPEVVTKTVPERIAAEEAAMKSAEAEVIKLRKQAADAEVAFAGATTGGDKIATGTAHGTLSGAVAAAEARLAAQKATLDELKRSKDRVRSDGLEPGSWQAQVADLRFGDESKGLGYTLKKKMQNPDLAIYKLQQTMYKFSFLLVPLSIPFMALLFLWKRRVTLYDHGVTVLYSLTFMALLLMATVVGVSLFSRGSDWIVGTALAVVPIHMFAQIKGAYCLGIFSALWRVFFLLIFCSIILCLFMLAIVYLGLGH